MHASSRARKRERPRERPSERASGEGEQELGHLPLDSRKRKERKQHEGSAST